MRPQVKYQHLGIRPITQLQHSFLPDPHPVPFIKHLPIELDAAAGYMHIGMVVFRQGQGIALVTLEQARIHPRVLPHLQ